jgi:predicted amidohydrolase
MTPFAIAGIQMRISASQENVSAMAHRLDILMTRFPWVQMVVFSELAAFGPLPGHAQTLPGPAEDAFREMASKHRIWLLPGSIFEAAGDLVYNTASVIDPNGHVVGRYRKMFPFQPYENHVEPGTDFLVFDVPDVGRFGVSICYDMWFPETSRTLASMGAEVILHPTMTDTIDRDVELSIARATAVTNQCYFFDINGVGDGGVGSSIIVGPAGYIIHQAGGGEEMIPVEINLGRVRREREVGIRSLGQPLKSFRDRPVDFPVYSRTTESEAYLQSLGPLTKPHRGSRAGLKDQGADNAEAPADSPNSVGLSGS